MPRILDLDLLRTFVAIVDAGGFTVAGERVGRSQPAISLQVKRLEEALGAILFTRRPRLRPTLTLASDLSVPHARALLRLNDATLADLMEPDITGLVRLGVPGDCATIHLPDVLAAFTDAPARQAGGHLRLDAQPAGRVLGRPF